MTVIWRNPFGGNFADNADWDDNLSPNGDDDIVLLPTLSAPYAVKSVNNDVIVGDLRVEMNATLAIGGGIFAIGAVAADANIYDQGEIVVRASGTLDLAGAANEIDGAGVLQLAGKLDIGSPLASLHGGQINLVGGTIALPVGNELLENLDDGIAGWGAIGGDVGGAVTSVTFSNGASGVINANGGADEALVLDTGSNRIENAGLLESTGAGGLVIESDLNQDGRLVASGAGGITVAGNATIEGLGKIGILAGSFLKLDDSALSIAGPVHIGSAAAMGGMLDVSGRVDQLQGEIYNYGAIDVAADATLMLDATILNSSGVINLGAPTGAGKTELQFYGGDSAIYGGDVHMSGAAEIDANGSAEAFDNYATVTGGGFIGDGWLALLNSAKGVIDGDTTSGLTIEADTLAARANTNPAAPNYNAGLIEATAAAPNKVGLLTIAAGEFDNGGAIFAASGGEVLLDGTEIETGSGALRVADHGEMILEDNAEVLNQSDIHIAHGGLLTTTDDNSDIGLSSLLINNGVFALAENSTAEAENTWLNNGVMEVGGSGGGAVLQIDAGAELSLGGAGTVALNNRFDQIVSGGAGAEFWNRGDKIIGEGVIGDANLLIENALGSTIDATGNLRLGFAGAPTIANSGLIEASRNATLIIENVIDNTGDLSVATGGDLVATESVLNAGRADIAAGGTLEFDGLFDGAVYFHGGKSATLILGAVNAENGAISGLGTGDYIDLANFKFGDGAFTELGQLGPLGGVAEFQNSLGDKSGPINLDGDYAASAGQFNFKSDGGNGTLIYWAPYGK